MKKLIVQFGHGGMFSRLNTYIAVLAWQCCHKDTRVIPVWNPSPYSERGTNAWGEYFELTAGLGVGDFASPNDIETCSLDDKRFAPYHLAAPRGPVLPEPYRKLYGCESFLAPPSDRNRANRLIQEHFVRKGSVVRAVYQKFSMNERLYEKPHVIGLHIRGPLRLHGGTAYLVDHLGSERPPYQHYFEAVEQELTENSLIMLATDAQCVADRVKERYKDKVVLISQCILMHGEPHRIRSDFTPNQLGMDALTDAYCLANANVFIHGNSNLSNFVLCLSPCMPHRDIFERVYPSTAPPFAFTV